ncbi:hypothetical protein [Halomonas sp. KAO]|uniref:hypothetical protein n=1 Tax=Halomonas sp. KAO TaxID=2783858 RepID=UPI001E4E214D|nr:hypothetical protein [Halomonas sp. KAO]
MSELYTLDECLDLYADAFCIGRNRECLFLSLWGRDTALQELLARLTLPTADNGLDTLHLCQDDTRHAMVFGDMDRYSRRSARLRQTRFGTLVHVWIFDQRCITPDRVNLHGIALLDDVEGAFPIDDQLWPRVQELSPLPLLDHWQMAVMTLLHTQHAVLPAPFSQGPIQAWEISLDESDLAPRLSGMIRAGVLTPEP